MATLFATYGWMAPGRNSGSRIVITQGVVDDRVTEYQAWSGTSRSAPDLSKVVEPNVRGEILHPRASRSAPYRIGALASRRLIDRVPGF